jgi:hypothetical protein
VARCGKDSGRSKTPRLEPIFRWTTINERIMYIMLN